MLWWTSLCTYPWWHVLVWLPCLRVVLLTFNESSEIQLKEKTGSNALAQGNRTSLQTRQVVYHFAMEHSQSSCLFYDEPPTTWKTDDSFLTHGTVCSNPLMSKNDVHSCLQLPSHLIALLQFFSVMSLHRSVWLSSIRRTFLHGVPWVGFMAEISSILQSSGYWEPYQCLSICS